MTFDEILKALKEAKIKQSEIDWAENIPEEIWEKILSEGIVVAQGIEVDKHRWYETSVTVVKIDERFLGINHVSDIFSETMDISDVYHTMKFFEMIEVNQPTYIIK